MLKKSLVIGIAMIGTVVLALASSGGGGSKKKSLASSKQGFSPLKSNVLTLKAGPNYSGSYIYSSQRNNVLSYNTLVTYKKGNTIFILPYKYKLNTLTAGARNNLNVLDLKINIRR